MTREQRQAVKTAIDRRTRMRVQTRVCEWCWGEFEPLPRLKDAQIYCSRSCNEKARYRRNGRRSTVPMTPVVDVSTVAV